MRFGLSRGNVLFLILLAVALFAALSYAVTQSSRSGGNDISDEDVRLAASQIIQHADLCAQTIDRMILINACNYTQISFQRDWNNNGNIEDNSDDYYNPNSPNDKRCHIYNIAGGGLTFQDADRFKGSLWHVSGRHPAEHPGSNPRCVFSPNRHLCTDLLLFLLNIPEKVCVAINSMLSVPNPSGSPPVDDSAGTQFSVSENQPRFQGTYGGYDDVSFENHEHAKCYEDSPDMDYFVFTRILIERSVHH